MTVYWANAIIYDPESRSTPIFHQSTYYSSITLENAQEVIELWKEIYPGKMVCSWIKEVQEGQPAKEICFNCYVDYCGKIDDTIVKTIDRKNKY